MPMTIAVERPDTPDAIALINELQMHLESFHPPGSRHGFSVDKLIAQGVAFFVLRVDSQAVGCGGFVLVGKDYGEPNRMCGQNFADGYSPAGGHPPVRALWVLRIPPFGPYFEDPVSRCYEMSQA